MPSVKKNDHVSFRFSNTQSKWCEGSWVRFVLSYRKRSSCLGAHNITKHKNKLSTAHSKNMAFYVQNLLHKGMA